MTNNIKLLSDRLFFENAALLPEFSHEEYLNVKRYFAKVDDEIKTGVFQCPVTNSIIYLKNNFPHNETGSALIYDDGSKEWWLDGIQYSEKEYDSYMMYQHLQKNLSENSSSHKPKL